MPVLRISQIGTFVESVFEDDGVRLSERRPFSFAISSQDMEDIRWYLEDYRIYPLDPAPKIAQRIQQHMAEVGRELFRLVLAGSNVWEHVRGVLAETRVEVETELADALVPWELMRDPGADLPLALEASSFVRSHPRPARNPHPAAAAGGKIRILLVICRLEDDQVPFRSVAKHLIRGLTDAAREPFHLEVLRPPTFEQLARRLRAAKAQGEPFHVVHFDGHGLSGKIYFENPALERNAQAVTAGELGKLLHETHVPLLILNACRSAASEPPDQPEKAGDEDQQRRQLGSFAHAMMDHGASGVVAWRYNVFVDTAAQYMADLYAALASGSSFGEAGSRARKQLSNSVRPIEDWAVPVVFEAVSLRLFPKTEETFKIQLKAGATADAGLPHPPDIGFIGRDETILKLDRTFDEQSIVLLHAYAGSGKTSTAAEFVRWYSQTGGVSGPVLFTSFEQHKLLYRVLDDFGRVFEGLLKKNGVIWPTLDDAGRRTTALQILQQIPVLWIWDNVEPIAGFPSGTLSAWSAPEQTELLDFLRAARSTKAKFLLTSRRDERDWLHDLPARVEIPPMPFDECVQMTAELAKKRGRRLEDVEDWRPLLRFTQGNPLTLTVLVGQALRDRLKSREQIESFVHRLQAGEAVFDDEASEGRTRSLAASLAYGFEHAFTDVERKKLALLYLFQGIVDLDALKLMRDGVSELKGLTRETAISLLDRSAEVGLLTRESSGYYHVHPALPWFFRKLFEQYYGEASSVVTGAWVKAMGELGGYYLHQYNNGHRHVIGILAMMEPNLLHARNLAISNGWWPFVIDTMQSLHPLYDYTGRITEWSRLVEETVPYFIDPASDGPLPGREAEWAAVNGFRVPLAIQARQWTEAEQWQTANVDRDRQRAKPILTRKPDSWSAEERHFVQSLAVSLQHLSRVQRERELPECVDGLREAFSLAQEIELTSLAAVCAFELGHAHKNLRQIRDLTAAEQWYRQSLELHSEVDLIGKGKCLSQLGYVAYERFLEARQANCPADDAHGHLSQAAFYYEQSLNITPASAHGERAVIHNQLGLIAMGAEQIDTALRHYREAIRLFELVQDRFGAGRNRLNTARALARTNRLAEARDWAQSALRDFRTCENADQEVVETLKLLEQIESQLRATSPPS